MRRTAHKLKTNRTTETPGEWVFLDTETLPHANSETETEHVLRLGVALYQRRARRGASGREEWYTFRDGADLWLWIDRVAQPHQRVVLIAHNTGFDLQVIGGFAAAHDHGWRVTKAIVDDPPFIVRLRRGTTSLLILDWYNYFRGSLAMAGSLLGVPKLPMPAWEAPDSEWEIYCRNDVLVLQRAVNSYVEWVEQYDLGSFAYTLAGQALAAYRHRFMDHPIYIHTRKDVISLERSAYFGGRTEVFFRGERVDVDTHYLDINSAYASVMATDSIPYALEGYEIGPSVSATRRLIQTHKAVARVRLATELPLFPVRTTEGLIFPVGVFDTSLCTPELEIAFQEGCVEHVYEAAYYRHAPLFSRFIDELYTMRQQAKARGDALWDELLKRMPNSLFGKFGQRNYEWEVIGYEPTEPDSIWIMVNADTRQSFTYRRLAGRVERRKGVEEAYNAFVAIAAHITSAARVLLLTFIRRAGWGNVLYCDTDSLFTTESGYRNLADNISPRTLGSLKHEGTTTHLNILAPKNYRFGENVHHKGRRRSATQNADGSYTQEQFVSLVGALRDQWTGGPLIRMVTKHDALLYRKGVVQSDGWVMPLRLGSSSGPDSEIEANYSHVERP